MSEYSKVNAYEELVSYLENGDVVEAIVFKSWEGEETTNPSAPIDKQMTLEQAKPYMQTWKLKTEALSGGFVTSGEFYLMDIWTKQWVYWTHYCYTGLKSTITRASRNPYGEKWKEDA